jgi:hypothetical protein
MKGLVSSQRARNSLCFSPRRKRLYEFSYRPAAFRRKLFSCSEIIYEA